MDNPHEGHCPRSMASEYCAFADAEDAGDRLKVEFERCLGKFVPMGGLTYSK